MKELSLKEVLRETDLRQLESIDPEMLTHDGKLLALHRPTQELQAVRAAELLLSATTKVRSVRVLPDFVLTEV